MKSVELQMQLPDRDALTDLRNQIDEFRDNAVTAELQSPPETAAFGVQEAALVVGVLDIMVSPVVRDGLSKVGQILTKEHERHHGDRLFVDGVEIPLDDGEVIVAVLTRKLEVDR